MQYIQIYVCRSHVQNKLCRIDITKWSITECPVISQIADFTGVVAIVNGVRVDHDDLFTFEDESFVYCASSTNGAPITITITFPEELILLEIDIRGNDRIFPFSNQYVTSFSLSYASNGTIVQYIRDTGSVVCIRSYLCLAIAS